MEVKKRDQKIKVSIEHSRQVILDHLLVVAAPKRIMIIIKKTSIMWPSQNFLLYIKNIIKMKVTEWINNLKKICQSPLWGYIQHV